MEDRIMKKALLLIAAAMFVFAGCQKEQAVQESKSNNVIHINVKQMSPATKVAANDITADLLTFKWEEGDEVLFLNQAGGDQTIFTCTNPTTNEFVKTSGNELVPDANYTILYPVNCVANRNPYKETYRENQIPKEHMVFGSGSGSNSEFSLSTHQKMIHIKLQGSAKVGSINYIYDGSPKTQLDCGDGVQLSNTPTDFYLDIFEASNSGFGLEIFDVSENSLLKQTTSFDLTEFQLSTMIDFDEPLTVNASSEPEYVVMKMGSDQSKELKWATMNLGATTVAGNLGTCAGYYLAWGAAELAYSSLSSDTFTFVASRPASYGGSGWTQSSGFAEVNTPYYDGSAYTKYTNSDSKTVLESGDDAATALLGSGWRMPTKEEFKALYDACGGTETPKTGGSTSTTEKGVYWCDNYDGVAGLLFCDGTNKLFFPATGLGRDTSLLAPGMGGCYWSSSLYTDDTDSASSLHFYNSDVDPQEDFDRRCGFSVRPVKDVPTE